MQPKEQEQPYKKEEIEVLNFLLARIRFILSRFGRLISIFEAISMKYKEDTNDDNNFLKPSGSSAQFSTMIEKKWKNLRKPSDKNMLMSVMSPRSVQGKKASATTILDTLSAEAKSSVIIQNCFKEQTSHWRSEFEAERLAMVPSVTCRICQ